MNYFPDFAAFVSDGAKRAISSLELVFFYDIWFFGKIARFRHFDGTFFRIVDLHKSVAAALFR